MLSAFDVMAYRKSGDIVHSKHEAEEKVQIVSD